MTTFRPMTIDDYDAVVALWKATEGMGLSKADTRERIQQYLDRNPGLSPLAFDEGGALVGAALCGHDGRRGYLHHVAVRADCRGQGLGRELVCRCLDGLRAEGIDRCHLFVIATNQGGRSFWMKTGWFERKDLVLMSIDV